MCAMPSDIEGLSQIELEAFDFLWGINRPRDEKKAIEILKKISGRGGYADSMLLEYTLTLKIIAIFPTPHERVAKLRALIKDMKTMENNFTTMYDRYRSTMSFVRIMALNSMSSLSRSKLMVVKSHFLSNDCMTPHYTGVTVGHLIDILCDEALKSKSIDRAYMNTLTSLRSEIDEIQNNICNIIQTKILESDDTMESSTKLIRKALAKSSYTAPTGCKACNNNSRRLVYACKNCQAVVERDSALYRCIVSGPTPREAFVEPAACPNCGSNFFYESSMH